MRTLVVVVAAASLWGCERIGFYVTRGEGGPGPSGPSGPVVDRLYAANLSGDLYEIDPYAPRMVNITSLGGGALAIEQHPDTGLVYHTNTAVPARLSAFDLVGGNNTHLGSTGVNADQVSRMAFAQPDRLWLMTNAVVELHELDFNDQAFPASSARLGTYTGTIDWGGDMVFESPSVLIVLDRGGWFHRIAIQGGLPQSSPGFSAPAVGLQAGAAGFTGGAFTSDGQLWVIDDLSWLYRMDAVSGSLVPVMDMGELFNDLSPKWQ